MAARKGFSIQSKKQMIVFIPIVVVEIAPIAIFISGGSIVFSVSRLQYGLGQSGIVAYRIVKTYCTPSSSSALKHVHIDSTGHPAFLLSEVFILHMRGRDFQSRSRFCETIVPHPPGGRCCSTLRHVY